MLGPTTESLKEESRKAARELFYAEKQKDAEAKKRVIETLVTLYGDNEILSVDFYGRTVTVTVEDLYKAFKSKLIDDGLI